MDASGRTHTLTHLSLSVKADWLLSERSRRRRKKERERREGNGEGVLKTHPTVLVVVQQKLTNSLLFDQVEKTCRIQRGTEG